VGLLSKVGGRWRFSLHHTHSTPEKHLQICNYQGKTKTQLGLWAASPRQVERLC
jgi:hypothetical protein